MKFLIGNLLISYILLNSLGIIYKDVKFIIQNLKRGWKGKLGIHAHNNKGLALANSLQAIKSNIDWVDSTILGMGRGAGNTCTKQLISKLYPNKFFYKKLMIVFMILEI